MFIGVTFGDAGESDPVAFLVVGLALGLAFVAWGLIPWLRIIKEEKRQREEAERLRAEQKAAKENEWKLCPNCGATSRGAVCEYCGSRLP
jgi:hypothetical protein